MRANPYRTILGTMGSVGVLLGVLLVALGSGPFAGGGLMVFGTVISVIGLVTVVGWAVLSGVEWAMRERAAAAEADPSDGAGQGGGTTAPSGRHDGRRQH